MREGNLRRRIAMGKAVMGGLTSGLYREIAIAIQKESGDSNGGNV